MCVAMPCLVIIRLPPRQSSGGTGAGVDDLAARHWAQATQLYIQLQLVLINLLKFLFV